MTLNCRQQTKDLAKSILSNFNGDKNEVIERIRFMALIDSPDLSKGKIITKNNNSDIRIALIRPLGTLSHSEEKEAVKEMGEPYQLEHLAARLLEYNYNVKIFDQLDKPFDINSPNDYPNLKSNDNLIKEIISWNPDVCMLTSFSYNFRKGLLIASKIKEVLNVPIVYGGYHITSVGKQYLLFDSLNDKNSEIFKEDFKCVFQHSIVDYACVGEGINILNDILEVLKSKKDPKEIRGLAFIENKKIYVTESDRVDLNEYPFPFRDNEFNYMKHYATGRGYPFFLLMTASGCRFNCEYCSTSLNYPGVRLLDTERVLKELQIIKDRFYVNNWPSPSGKIMINIIDEDFAYNSKRVIELCDAITASGLNNYFEFNSFLDNLTILGPNGDLMLDAMKKAGFVFSFIGVESMLDLALEGYSRPDRFMGNRLIKIQEAIDKMAKHGLMYFGDHIGGFPAYDSNDLKKDYANFLQLRRQHYAYFPIIAAMPGTPLYWKVILGQYGKGFLDYVKYDHLDANRQTLAIKDDGDVKAIRKIYVEKFFLRKEYKNDALDAINKQPELAIFFANMLRKVSLDYFDNLELRNLAKEFEIIAKKSNDKKVINYISNFYSN